MKFSLNLAQYYGGDVDFTSIETPDLLQKMGLQLGSIESYESYGERYESISVVKVVRCEKHPNADKLNVCHIDDGGMNQHVERGDDGLVQVVCGAPNVHADMYVAWIPPGATVPSTFTTDPFVLEARELRGLTSNGMLASPKELDVSDEHDGILEIVPEDIGREPVVGEPFVGLYGLNDVVVTCENKMFTHRPDCFGNLGIAREVAGIFGKTFKSPEWYWNVPTFETVDSLPLVTKNDIPVLVPRFMALVLNGIEIKPSPLWMQIVLKRVGIKPINNVVDITNYIMHLTGQPLHAFDYVKLQQHSDAPSLFPRMAKKGEKLILLGNKTVELTEDDMVIATDKKAVALAGVMGGAETEVDETTKSIVVECANFDMYTIRRTSMRHGVFTDAVTRFNKGQSPLQNDKVLAYALKLLQEHASATQASNVYDICSFDKATDNLNRVELHISFINSRLGTCLETADVAQLLENVEFDVTVNGDNLLITAPFWRMDIAIAEDIVEEVGRLYGYENVPIELPQRSTKPSTVNTRRLYMHSIRNRLKCAGANEVLTYSFVHGDLMRHTGTDPEKWAYHIRNALSPDLQYYRTSLVPSLLAKVRPNIKAQAGREDNAFVLFEFGKVHVKGEFEAEEPSLPKQMRHLGGVYAAEARSTTNSAASAYFQAKMYVDLLTEGHAKYVPLESTDYPVTAAYLKERAALVMLHNQIIGVVGELHLKTQKYLKLPHMCAAFELDTDLLQDNLNRKTYKPLSSYPSTTQDITFELSSSITWDKVHELLHAELAVSKAELGYDFTVAPLDIFQSDDASLKRSTFRIELTHHQKTLKTEEVNILLEQIAKAAHETLHAIRI
jgi:phenylalanyl-tRNA synthetase beta chain